MYCIVVIMYLVISMSFATGETNCGQFRTWIKGSIGVFITDLIMDMHHLMWVKKNHKDNLYIMVLSYVVLLFNTSWFIWGNVLYY